jgi:hypothetical protein
MNANEKHIPNVTYNDDGDDADDMDVPEFDFDGALPNPFVEQYRRGVWVTVLKADGTKEHHVRLDADVAERFSSPKMVNDTLRSVMRAERQQETKVHGQDA